MDYFPDKNPQRIFIGGLSMGASMALATYLRSDLQLGGIISMYGVNPLTYNNMNQSPIQSQIPILLFNNDYILDNSDVKYSADFIKRKYQHTASLYEYINTQQLGNIVSNMLRTM